MSIKKCQNISGCIKDFDNLSKLFILTIIFGITLIPAFKVYGEDSHSENNSYLRLEYLGPHAKIATRGPNNFVPDDDVEPLPLEVKIWVQDILVEDSAGVLNKVKGNIKSWRDREEYAKTWNLSSTGLFVTPDSEEKEKFLKQHMLQYLDKRLSGEIRNAKEGSALHRLGQVEKALQPKAEASITSNIKIKLNAKVIEQRIFLLVDNPFIDYETKVDNHGRVEMKMGKNIESINVQSEIRYDIAGDKWVAEVVRPINSNLKAKISSSQDDNTMMFTKNSDNKVELIYNKSF